MVIKFNHRMHGTRIINDVEVNDVVILLIFYYFEDDVNCGLMLYILLCVVCGEFKVFI
jgi:hypothetical protein